MSSRDRRRGTTGGRRRNSMDSFANIAATAGNASVDERVRARREDRKLVPSVTKLFPVYTQLDINLDWKITGMGLLIETLQLVGLTLNPNFNWGPVMGSAVSKIVYFFDFPLFDGGWASNTFTVTSIFFWVFLVVLLVWLSITLYFAAHNFHTLPRPIVVFTRTVLHAVSSFALIPVAMLFSCFLVCSRDKNTKYVMLYWFDQKYRYLHGYAGALFAFGIVGLAALFIVAATGALFVFDDMPDSSNLVARSSCGMTTATMAFKLCSTVLFHVLLSLDQAQALAAVLCIAFGLLGVGFVMFLPYYNLRMNQFRAGQLFLAAVFAGVAALDVPTDSTWHTKSISTAVVLVLGVAAFVFGWFVALARVRSVYLGDSYSDRTRLPRTETSGVDSDDVDPEDFIRHDSRQFPKYLPTNDLIFTRYPALERLLLTGALNDGIGSRRRVSFAKSQGPSQSDGSQSPQPQGDGTGSEQPSSASYSSRGNQQHALLDDDQTAVQGPYIREVLAACDVELATRFLREYARRTGSTAIDPPPSLCAFAARIYMKGMVKYPEDAELRYHFCLFLAVYARRLRMGLGELLLLQHTLHGKISLPLRFRMYRLSTRAKLALDSSNTHQTQLLAVSSEAHKEVLAVMATFWDYLTTASHNTDYLTHIADYITVKREECRACYAKTLQYPSEVVLLNYVQFLRDVMLDNDGADTLHERVMEEARMHQHQQVSSSEADGTTATDSRPLGNALRHQKRPPPEEHWHGSMQLINSPTDLHASTLGGNANNVDQGHFVQGSYEVKLLRITVYTVLIIVMFLTLGLIMYAAFRVSVLDTLTARISAASDARLYSALGGVLVGQVAYVDDLGNMGMSAPALAKMYAYLKTQIAESGQLVLTAHDRLTHSDLYTGSPAITSYINSKRTEMIEVGINSIEGPNSRVLVDVYSLGTRVGYTLTSIGADPLDPTFDQTSMEYIKANSEEGTFTRAFNHSVSLYVKQRIDYLNNTVWVLIVFVAVAIFLLVGVYTITRVYLHRISLAKTSTINLFALIPHSYLEELHRCSRERLNAYELEDGEMTTAAAGAGAAAGGSGSGAGGAHGSTSKQGSARRSNSHTKDTRSNGSSGKGDRAGSTKSSPVLRLDEMDEEREDNNSDNSTNGVASTAAADTAAVSATGAATQPTLLGVAAMHTGGDNSAAPSRSNASATGEGIAGAASYEMEDGSGEGVDNEFSIKRIEHSSSTDYSGECGLDGGQGHQDATGTSKGNDSGPTWFLFKMIGNFIMSPVVVNVLLLLCVGLTIAAFALSYRLNGVTAMSNTELVELNAFRMRTGQYYEYMSTLGRHAQQYVVTGDIVHVERYYAYMRSSSPDKWFADGILQEKSIPAVEAAVGIRTVVNSAMTRQQIAMWLASLAYAVSVMQLNVFARVGAVRREYDFIKMQDAATILFADYKPNKPDIMASLPDTDEALDPDDQLRIASNLVFDDFYQSHRFLIVHYLQQMVANHKSEYESMEKHRRSLWVALVVVESISVTLFLICIVSYIMRHRPKLATLGLIIAFCAVVVSLVLLTLTHVDMAESKHLNREYSFFLSIMNSTIITLEATRDYALRIQRMGYLSAQAEWAKNRGDGAFNDTLTHLIGSLVTEVINGNGGVASVSGAYLIECVQRIAYETDITAALSSNAYNLPKPAVLDNFQYNRELEPLYHSDFFLFGDDPIYYTSNAIDMAATEETQLIRALHASAGERFEFVTKTYQDTINTAVVTIGAAISTNLDKVFAKMEKYTGVVTIISIVLMAVTIATVIYASFSLLLRATKNLSTLTRAAAVAGRRSTSSSSSVKKGSHTRTTSEADPTTMAGVNGINRHRRLQVAILLVGTAATVGLFVVVLILGLLKNRHEVQTSKLLDTIRARDWSVMDAIIKAQRIWHNTEDLDFVSPHMTDFIQSVTDALAFRVGLYLGDGGSFTGLLGQNRKQDIALFGSEFYGWETYKSTCTPFAYAFGTAVMDFPPHADATVTEKEMMQNLLVSGVENVVWQIVGLYLAMMRMTSTITVKAYESSFISVFPTLTDQLHNSAFSYFDDRSASGTSLVASFMAVAVVLLVVLMAVFAFLFHPLLNHLADEEEGTRLLLSMIPDNVRRDVPAITDFFRTGSINKDAELIKTACNDLQSTSMIIVSNDDTIISATEEALRQFHRSTDEVVGARFESLFSKERGAELMRHREEYGCSQLTQLAGKELRTVGRRPDGVLFPVSACVREVFTNTAMGESQSMLSRQGSGGGKGNGALSKVTAGSSSVFVIRFTDIGVKSDLEFVRRLQATLFDGCRQPQVVLDPAGHIRLINDAALRLFGYRARELAGVHLHALLHHDSIRASEEVFEDLIAKSRAFGVSVSATTRVIAVTKDTSDIHLEVNMTTVMTQNELYTSRKEVSAIVAHIRDVSQDLLVQQADLASKAIIDLSPVPVIVFNEAGCIRTFSTAAERSWGCCAESVLGCPLNDLLAPADCGTTFDFTSGSHTDLRHFLVGSKVLTGRRFDTGEHFLVEVSMRDMVRSSMSAATYIGYFRDLSFETRLATRNVLGQSAFDRCPLPIIVSDDMGTIITMSPAAERTFGYGPSEALGCKVDILMPEHVAKRHGLYVAAYRERSHCGVIDETPRVEFARRADGRLFTVEITLKDIAVADFVTDHRASVHDIPTISGSLTNRATNAASRRLLVAYVRDTSQEQQVSRANSIHQALIKNSSVPMMSVNAAGIIQYANPALGELFLLDLGQLVGSDASQVLFPASADVSDLTSGSPTARQHRLHNKQQQGNNDGSGDSNSSETFSALLEAARAGSAMGILAGRTSSQREFPTEVCVQELQRGEDAHRYLDLEKLFVVSLRDVARQLTVEAGSFLERAFISSYPGSIVVVSEQGLVRFLSDQARKLLGVAENAPTTGLRVSNFFTPFTRHLDSGDMHALDDAEEYSLVADTTLLTAHAAAAKRGSRVLHEIIAAATAAAATHPFPGAVPTPKQKTRTTTRPSAEDEVSNDDSITLECIRRDGQRFPVAVRVRKLCSSRATANTPTGGDTDSSAKAAAAAVVGEGSHGNSDEAAYVLLIRDPIQDSVVEESMAVKNAILEQIELGVVLVDAAGTMLTVNNAFLRMFANSSAAHVIGKNIATIMTQPRSSNSSVLSDAESENVTIMAQRLEKLLLSGSRGQAASYEMLVVRADGVHMHVSVTVGDAGPAPTTRSGARGTSADSTNPDAFFVFIRNSDVQVQAYNRQHLLVEVLRTSPLAMVVLDSASPTTSIRLFNSAAEELFKCSASAANAQGIDALLTVGSGSDSLTDACGVLLAAGGHVGGGDGEGSPSVALRAQGRRSDGTSFPATVHAAKFFFGETGSESVLLFVEETTTQVLLELERAASRTIEDASPYGIICLNEKREVVLFSRQAAAMFQCPEAAMLGKDVTTLLSEQAARRLTGLFSDMLAAGSDACTPSSTATATATAAATAPRKLYRQVAKRLGVAAGAPGSIFPSEWILYEVASPPAAHAVMAAEELGKEEGSAVAAQGHGRTFVALVRDTTTATSDTIAAAISKAAMLGLSVPLLTFTNVGVVTMANAAIAKLFGYDSSDDLVGHSAKMLLSPDVVFRLQKLKADLLAAKDSGSGGGSPSLALYTAGRRKNGEPVLLEVLVGLLPPQKEAAEAVCRSDGTPLAASTADRAAVAALYCFVNEIGDRVAIKKRLAFNEAIAAMEDLAVLFVDRHGTITYAGESARQLFGREVTSTGAPVPLAGLSLSAVLDLKGPFSNFVKEYEAAVASGRQKSVFVKGRRLDRDTVLPCTVRLRTAAHGDADDAYICLITSAFDREGVEKSAKVMDAVNGLALMPVIVADEKGIIHHVNKEALQLFRYSDFDEMVGQTLDTVMTPAEATAHHERLTNYLRGFKRNTNVIGHTRRVIGTRKDQTSCAVDISIDETVTATGGHRFIAYMDDLTDTVHHEGAVRMVDSVLGALPAMALVLSGDDGKILQVSAAALTRLGRDKADVVDHTLDELLRLDSYQAAVADQDRHLANLLKVGEKAVAVLPGTEALGDVSEADYPRTTIVVSELGGADVGHTLLCLVRDW